VQAAELVLDLGGLFRARRKGRAAPIGMVRQRRLIDSARAVPAEPHAYDFRIARAVIQAVLERCDESKPA
jgi:hypothetical protein